MTNASRRKVPLRDACSNPVCDGHPHCKERAGAWSVNPSAWSLRSTRPALLDDIQNTSVSVCLEEASAEPVVVELREISIVGHLINNAE
jgi:hypothetical protein